MTYLHYLILDLFYDETISEHHITHPEFDLAFNVESYNSTPEQRMEVVKYFLNNKILELSKYGSFQLTKNGGKYWEKLFCPNWDLYFEFYSICDENYLSTTCFCATKLEIVQRFINLSNGLLDGFQIKKAENWKPIYWKPLFDGFCIEIEGSDEHLVQFAHQLPNFKKEVQDIEDDKWFIR